MCILRAAYEIGDFSPNAGSVKGTRYQESIILDREATFLPVVVTESAIC